ncbi:potassium-transporting ATPase subunit B, partial [Candidatus Bathyarchaeota archaeon]
MQTMKHLRRPGLLTSLLSRRTLRDSLIRLNPASLLSNPVMFIVELTFFVVAAMAVYPPAFYPVASLNLRIYYVEIALILLLTVWFATLSNALAESQAKNTANSLRSLESEVQSKKILVEGDVRRFVATPSTALRKGDLILLEKNDVVPIDAEILEGISMVDESLLTGESTPVRKAPGDEVIGGSKIISDNLTARVTVNPEETYISQMI